MSVLDTARKALGFAAATGVEQSEAFAQLGRSLRVKVYRQEVEELVSSTGSGVGIRVFSGGSVGYAYTSDLSDESLKAAAQAAADAMSVTAPDEFAGLPEPAGEFSPLELYSPELAALPVADKIAFAMRVEKAALGSDSRISQVESATYSEGDSHIALANSLGFEHQFSETSCYSFLQAIAEQDGQMQTGISFTTGRNLEQMDAEATGREAAWRALSLLGAGQCASMSCPVVMDPFVTASVIGAIGSVLTGEAVQKKRSMFAGREGQRVAGALVNLLDDGIHPDGLATAPFDGEGVPTRQTGLIKNGELQAFLYDTYSGRKDGRTSTGNGARGSYRSQPRVSPTNLRLLGGSVSPGQMLAGVDLGFYVMDVTGMHSGVNPVSGDFSVGATGRLIRGGSLAEAVREVTIAGNLLDMLDTIKKIGNDNRWVPFGGSIHAPSIMIGQMTVSGK